MAKSNADSKLRNVDAVKQMLAGTHKFQNKTSVALSELKGVDERREVGETWTDADGNEWEQKAGYRIRKGKLDELRSELKSFPNCRKETCTCIDPGQADEKMRKLHGMCLDCTVDMEHNLRLEGKFEEYAINKMKLNAFSWLRDAEKEVEALKIAVTIAPEFVTVDGQVNKWDIQYDPEKMKESIDLQLQQYKEEIYKRLGTNEDEFIKFKTQKQ